MPWSHGTVAAVLKKQSDHELVHYMRSGRSKGMVDRKTHPSNKRLHPSQGDCAALTITALIATSTGTTPCPPRAGAAPPGAPLFTGGEASSPPRGSVVGMRRRRGISICQLLRQIQDFDYSCVNSLRGSPSMFYRCRSEWTDLNYLCI